MAVIVGVAALVLLPRELSPNIRHAVAWIAGGLVYLGFALQAMLVCTPDIIAKRAARQDDSRMVIMALILLAIGASFVSIVGLLGEAKPAPPQTKWLYLALAAGTLVVSWTVMQFVFTLHYAHEFYRPDFADRSAGPGLEFPGEDKPDYWDFLYFATSFGAASQTSDVCIRSRPLRRLATIHAIVSFFFNAAVLALMINLAASLI